MAILRLASAADAEPDPRFVEAIGRLTDALHAKGVGFFCVVEEEGGREIFAAGDLDVDGIAGFAARCLASMANAAGDE